MSNILDLGGKIALVAGAGQGIECQVALQLAAHNVGAIVVNDFSELRAQAVSDEARALGVRAIRSFAPSGFMTARPKSIVGRWRAVS